MSERADSSIVAVAKPLQGGRGSWLALVGFVVLFMSGCAQERDLSALAEPAGLEAMSPAIREQYESLQGDLERALRDPEISDSVLAESVGEVGLWHHTYQLSVGAEAAYLEARRLAPNDFRWAYYLGLLYAALGRADDARSEWQMALTGAPDDVPTLVRLAELEWAAGEIDGAEERLERALAVSPDCVRGLVGLAMIAESRGDGARAVEILERARDLQEGSSQVRYALAQVYRDMGELERAEALLAVAEPEASPEDARMRDPLAARLRTLDVGLQGNLRRAREAERRGRPEAALSHFRRAAEGDPESIAARLGVARSLVILGRADRSIEELRSALAIHPDSPRLHSALGTRLAVHGLPEQAREHFLAALAIQSSSRPALRGLGDLLAADGDFEGALDSYQGARSLGLTAELAERHAIALIHLGRHGEALRALEEDSARLDPDRLDPDRSLGLLLSRLLATSSVSEVRDGRRALRLARTAFEAAPGLDAAEVTVMALAEMGDFRAAASGQRLLAQAVKQAGRSDLWPMMRDRLALFERRRPFREPLSSEEGLDAIFVDPEALAAVLDQASSPP